MLDKLKNSTQGRNRSEENNVHEIEAWVRILRIGRQHLYLLKPDTESSQARITRCLENLMFLTF